MSTPETDIMKAADFIAGLSMISKPERAEELHQLSLRLRGAHSQIRRQAMLDIARAWPTLTRDMVSRMQVRTWLFEQAQKEAPLDA